MDIAKLMKKYNIRADKRLGQHFLAREDVLYEMVKAAGISKNDAVLEIGPGLGVLTTLLCKKAGEVVAVEKDSRFVPILEKVTRQFKNICIIKEDVLKLDIENLQNELSFKFKVVANLPYYITSPIIMKLLSNRHIISLAVIMVQKEVAERLISSPGTKDYGILTIAVGLHADVEMVCNVSKNAFIPPPKVDSAVVKIIPRKSPRVKLCDEELFFEVVRASFGQRRKTIRNSLKNSLNLPIDIKMLDVVLKKARIDPKRRGETLSIEEFARLSGEFYNHIHKS